jgi:D-glycero-D-manno-heptose 1,7-bisphosphate phosphatase
VTGAGAGDESESGPSPRLGEGDVPRPPRAALFVDLDGTVRTTRSGRPHPVQSWDQRLRPGVAARLAAYRDRGYLVVGVTNQGGVAMGFLTEADVQAINRRLTEELAPGLFDLVLYCPYHPRGRVAAYRRDADCRKPRPGMAYEARDRLGIDLGASIMVGDREDDRNFALQAGIPTFYWADDFFVPGEAEPAPPARSRRASASE